MCSSTSLVFGQVYDVMAAAKLGFTVSVFLIRFVAVFVGVNVSMLRSDKSNSNVENIRH